MKKKELSTYIFIMVNDTYILQTNILLLIYLKEQVCL